MPAYKDGKTWMARFYYTDFTGARRQKKKRGFATMREAKDYERDFKAQTSRSIGMTFGKLVDVYLSDSEGRVRASTIENKRAIIETWILPYFKRRALDEITPIDVREWQNKLMSYHTKGGNLLKPTYLRSIHAQLSAIFNYAVKFYQLPQNPCKVTGGMGENHADSMKIWTESDFKKFIALVDRPDYHLAFDLLFYDGLRCGELLALLQSDLNDNNELSITKSYKRTGRQDSIGPTKTRNSIRKVPTPQWLADEYREYCRRLYGLQADTRIFPWTAHALKKQADYYADKAGLPRIRLHDFRHSSASYLIDMGASVALVAERLGDTMQMIMRTYAHLYPIRQIDIIEQMQRSGAEK